MVACGSPVLKPLLMTALLCALAIAGAEAREACPPVTDALEDEASLMTGYMPTFQSGEILPVAGVFDLILQPVADVFYQVKFERADEGGYGGIVTIVSVAAGRYRIIFSRQARVDAAQRYALLPSQRSVSETRCSNDYLAMQVTAEEGALTLQVSSASKPLISIAVIRLSDASGDVRENSQP
jgi:hypothetical protein